MVFSQEHGDFFQPQYFEGEQFDPGGWTTERIAKLQRDLVTSNLLTESFSFGVWDQTSAAAYAQLLGASNMSGMDWADQLKQFKEVSPEETYQAFRVPKILLPDMDNVKLSVEEEFARQLGRDPTDNERGDMADWLMGRFEAQREQAIDIEREAWEGGYAEGQPEGAGMTPAQMVLQGEDAEGESGDIGYTRPVNQIDPASEFQRRFRKRYRQERRVGEAREQSAEDLPTMQGGFDMLRSMIGGL
jgi:hypothetical protein